MDIQISDKVRQSNNVTRIFSNKRTTVICFRNCRLFVYNVKYDNADGVRISPNKIKIHFKDDHVLYIPGDYDKKIGIYMGTSRGKRAIGINDIEEE